MAEITFTGNVGKEPSLEFTPNGNPKLTFSVADSKSKPDGNGGWEKLAEHWLRVTVWGPLAEYLAELVNKGSRVKVYGEFYAREYQDKEGVTRTSLDVTADGVKVFPPKGQQQSRQPATVGAPAADPWATPAANAGGWGNAPDSEPPF